MNRVRTGLLLAAATLITTSAFAIEPEPGQDRGEARAQRGDRGEQGARPDRGGQRADRPAIAAPAPVANAQPQDRRGAPGPSGRSYSGQPNPNPVVAQNQRNDDRRGNDQRNYNGRDNGRPNVDVRRGNDDRPGFNGNNRGNDDRRADNDRRGDNRPGFGGNYRGNDNRPGWNNNNNNRPGWNDNRGNNRADWRNDRRYDWRSYRNVNRSLFHGRYNPPRGYSYGYRPFSIGFRLDPFFYASNYWIADPWQYRLPPVDGPYRWVRYYDDVLLVDLRTGQVVDVIQGLFW